MANTETATTGRILYDNAIAEKINEWLPKDGGITVLKPADVKRLITIQAHQHNDSPLPLPMIVLSRDSTTNYKDPRMTRLSYEGIDLGGNETNRLILHVIPIELTYQLDIYAEDLEDAEAIWNDLSFNLTNEPQIVITIPYSGLNDEPHTLDQISDIKLHPETEDTSDIPERLYAGEFTRYTLRFDVHGANLYKVDKAPTVKIGHVGVKTIEKHPQRKHK